MRFRFEQSPTEIYSGSGGLSLVGSLINRYSELSSQLKSLPLRHGISHEDIMRTYLGLLCQGKNDFEAVEGVREDTFFRQALGIKRAPSAARLRQRLDEHASALTQVADTC